MKGHLPEDLAAAALRVLASHADVSAAYVFGSQSTGDARADSDIDLGVLYRTRQPFATTAVLEERLILEFRALMGAERVLDGEIVQPELFLRVARPFPSRIPLVRSIQPIIGVR